jgi:hypothetical protein
LRFQITDGNEVSMSKAVSAIIEDLGGATGISTATGITRGAVGQWKFKNRIPRRAWPDLIAAFPGKVDLDALLATEDERQAA